MNGQSPAFVLLTDFGEADPYAGQLKAALFAQAPSVPILDLSLGVPPFSVMTGAFFLAASRRFYPRGAIFLCVVDPGVGSERALLCLTGKNHALLGPDNGLMALAYRDMLEEGSVTINRIAMDHAPGSATFHGRDILAPAAAALANGASPVDLGPGVENLLFPAWTKAEIGPQGALCTVLHVDRFGNCILNLPAAAHAALEGPLVLEMDAGHRFPLRTVNHYAELPGETPGILAGSQGFCELACNHAPAAELLWLRSGGTCRIVRGTL